jgi:cytochrome P450
MTSIHIHENPSIFPEPFKFKPERWLEKRPEGAPPLDRYLISFSKGSRQCVGMTYALLFLSTHISVFKYPVRYSAANMMI